MKPRRHVVGLHAVEAALQHGPERIVAVWVDATRTDERLARLLDQLRATGVKPQGINKSRLDSLAEGQAHQGVVIEVIAPDELGENALRTALETPGPLPLPTPRQLLPRAGSRALRVMEVSAPITRPSTSMTGA